MNAATPGQRMITVGRLHGAFGVRGEVKLESFTDPSLKA
jgi:16S rRNA processing protein RimM